MNAYAHLAQIALEYNYLGAGLTSLKFHELLEKRNLVFGTLPLSVAHLKSLVKCYQMVGTEKMFFQSIKEQMKLLLKHIFYCKAS